MDLGSKDARWAQRELIAGALLFAGLPGALLDELAATGRILKFQPNDFLFRADEPIREAYLLIGGTVKRSTRLAGAAEKVLELVQPQQMLGLAEVFGSAAYGSAAQAITPCLTVALDARKLRAITRHDIELSWRVIQALAQRQHAIEFDTTGYHHGLTGTQRVLDYLVKLSDAPPALAGETTVTLKTSKKIAASRVGMTPETFSRSLRLLSDRGVIVVEGRQIHIQNAALLDTGAGNESRPLVFPRQPKTPVGRESRLSPGALINLCARPRVLSQRLAIAWAQIGRNIGAGRAELKLRQLRGQFDQNLDRLGRLDLPEALAARFAAVRELWPRYADALFGAAPALPAAPTVLRLSEEILDAVDRLAGEAEAHAGQPAVHYVNVAGRNRMLTQRIGKLFLFRAWGVAADGIEPQLEASCREFERNLAELQQTGMALPELTAQLHEVDGQWRKFRKALQPDLAHAPRSGHAQAVVAEGERLLRLVDTAVKLYERLAK